MIPIVLCVLAALLLSANAVYPTAKVHRVSRRKLGRGQYPPVAALTFTMTDTGSTATLTFTVPVVVSGPINLNVSGGLTYVSQSIVSPYVVTQTYSGALSAKTWSVAANTPNVASAQGGGTAGQSGTFS